MKCFICKNSIESGQTISSIHTGCRAICPHNPCEDCVAKIIEEARVMVRKEERAFYIDLLADAKKQFDKDLLQMKAEYYSRKKTPNTHLPDEDCDKSCTH